MGKQWETKGDKTSGRRAQHPTQAHVWGDNGRHGETRPLEGGYDPSRRHHPTQAPIGETMGDNGETRPRKTDTPSSTGTHVGRHWETMKRNRRQRETGRQEGRQWEAIGWTMGDNGRQMETRPRGSGQTIQHRQTRGDNTAGRRTHHPRLRHQPTQAHMWGDKGRQDLEKADTPSNTGTHI